MLKNHKEVGVEELRRVCDPAIFDFNSTADVPPLTEIIGQACITARTSMGKGGVINIDREAKLGGRIHNKGVMILTGYLNGKFAQETPLTFYTSITFEQLYEEVEGESASSAELYICPSFEPVRISYPAGWGRERFGESVWADPGDWWRQ